MSHCEHTDQSPGMSGGQMLGGWGMPRVRLQTPKPARVADHYRFWGEQPPEPSARCLYWVRMIRAGWRPNRRIDGMGYDESAQWYGVYMWEYLHVLFPMRARLWRDHVESAGAAEAGRGGSHRVWWEEEPGYLLVGPEPPPSDSPWVEAGDVGSVSTTQEGH